MEITEVAYDVLEGYWIEYRKRVKERRERLTEEERKQLKANRIERVKRIPSDLWRLFNQLVSDIRDSVEHDTSTSKQRRKDRVRFMDEYFDKMEWRDEQLRKAEEDENYQYEEYEDYRERRLEEEYYEYYDDYEYYYEDDDGDTEYYVDGGR